MFLRQADEIGRPSRTNAPRRAGGGRVVCGGTGEDCAPVLRRLGDLLENSGHRLQPGGYFDFL
jgi:hypothetical protein